MVNVSDRMGHDTERKRTDLRTDSIMKQISINLYEFGELGEEARKRAIEDNRSWVGEGQTEIDGDAFWWTLKEMEKALGVSVRDDRAFTWRLQGDGERWEEVMDDPAYLVRYLNWVDSRVDDRKVYWLPFGKSRYFHSTMTRRVSNISVKGYDHSLTGEWTDGSFCEFMRRRWEFVREGWTIDRFVDALVCKFRDEWDKDTEWAYSDENVVELLSDQGWLFLEDGRKYSI